MVDTTVQTFFKKEIINGLNLFIDSSRRDGISFTPITSNVEEMLFAEYRKNVNAINMVCPNIAEQLRIQEFAFVKWACIILAEWGHDPEDIARAGCLLIEKDVFFSWIAPNMIKYEKDRCLSDYRYGSFDMLVVEGEPAYLLGSKDHYYRGNSTPGERSALVLAEDGFVECGGSGNIESLWIEFEGESARSPVIQNPMMKLPKQRPAATKWTILDSMGRETMDLFQYRTCGMMYVPSDVGVKIWVIPSITGIIKPIPLGFGFCETGFVNKYLDKREVV